MGLDTVRLADAASTLLERLDGGFLPAETAANKDTITARFKRWRRLVSGGDEEIFERRLSWDGLDVDTIRLLFGRVRRPHLAPAPGWVRTLSGILGAIPADSVENHRFLDPQQPIPFEEVLAPIVVASRHLLEYRDELHSVELSPAVWAGLERGLLVWLSSLAGRCLQLEFERFRAIHQTAFARVLANAAGDCTRDLYDAFVRNLTGGGLAMFLKRYPVLARLLAQEVEFWGESIVELLLRLESDLVDLGREFGGGDSLGSIERIRSGLSDPHNGGRTVAVITFSSGTEVVYKPRPVGMEAGFSHILGWINDHDPSLHFKTLHVLERDGYGWVGFIDQLPCRDAEETQRFFHRAGMLLAILYVLSGSDVHFENIVAHGEHPIPVDLEALFHPKVRPDPGTDGAAADDDATEDLTGSSVIDVGLLPYRSEGPRGETFDLSGLGHFEAQRTSFQEPIWRDINTDGMSLVLEDYTSRSAANAPTLNGHRLRPDEHVDNIVSGFREMYRFFRDHRTGLLDEDSPFVSMCRRQNRFIARPTQVYASVLKRALRPDSLRDGVDFGIELEALCRPLLQTQEKPKLWPLLRHEIRALERLDVPYFTNSTASDSLRLGPNEIIEGCFAGPSYEQVVTRLRELDDADLERQVRIIREALETVAVLNCHC